MKLLSYNIDNWNIQLWLETSSTSTILNYKWYAFPLSNLTGLTYSFYITTPLDIDPFAKELAFTIDYCKALLYQGLRDLLRLLKIYKDSGIPMNVIGINKKLLSRTIRYLRKESIPSNKGREKLINISNGKS